MKQVVDFLEQLGKNNDKVWFDAHRKEYLEVKATIEDFARKLIEGISLFDETVQGVALKDCLYRINRDTRFSNNKLPYKTHFGIYVAPHGKKSGYAGYYFHIEIDTDGGFIGKSLLAAGSYMPENKVLESIRTEIFDYPERFEDVLSSAEGFVFETHNALKNVPKGFPADFRLANYLKSKEFSLYMPMSMEQVLSEDLLSFTLDNFRKCTPFISFVNRAIEFAKTEM